MHPFVWDVWSCVKRLTVEIDSLKPFLNHIKILNTQRLENYLKHKL